MMKSLVRTLVVALGLATLVVSPLAAQDAPRTAAEERATSFQAVSGAERENVPGGPLLLGAYALVWGLTMAYVFRLGRLQSTLESDVARLSKDLADTKAKQA